MDEVFLGLLSWLLPHLFYFGFWLKNKFIKVDTKVKTHTMEAFLKFETKQIQIQVQDQEQWCWPF